MKISLLQRLAANGLLRAMTALFVLVMFSALAFGQTETGQISGTVTDQNGAVIPGATVTVKAVNTGAVRNATASDEGVYTVTNLQPGPYEVTAQSGSFAPTTTRVEVTTGGKLTADVQLGVTIQGATVNVTTEGGAEVNTTNQELSDVVTGTQLRELPTLTRNPYSLVQLSGNASNDSEGSGRGTGFSLNGQRSASTNILLDGGENVDNFTATVGQSVPLDSVQEFRVITSNFSAEYGRASGGVVNVTTRPGTNEFHGTLYEFNRVSRLASNDFESNARNQPRAQFVRNQFGYSVGGPILKNKLFFFNSTEWTRVRSAANTVNLVPTPQLLNASAASTRSFFAGQSLAFPINGTIFTVADVRTNLCGSPCTNANFFAGSFFTLPDATPAFGEVKYTVPANAGAGTPQNTYQTVIRIDWNLSDKTQIYGRYALESQKFLEGSNASSPYTGFNTGALAFNQNSLLNFTHSFSSNFVSQTKLVFNRLNSLQPLGDAPVQPTLYLRSAQTSLFGSLVALPGYLPFNPGSAIPFGGPQNVGQLYQDINYIRGNHQFRFGGTYVYMQDNRTFGAYQNAVQTLHTTTTRLALNNFVAGNVARLQVAIDPQGNFFPGSQVTLPLKPPLFTRYNRYHEWALYLNDAWRVHPRVTVNLGLRYEYYGVQKNKDPNLDSNFYYGAGATIQERIRNGRIFRAPESPVGALWRKDLNNFAPRLGIAWDVFGDGRTSLRGGYGVAYERNFGNVTFNIIQNAPAYAVVTIDAGAPGFATIPINPNNFGPLSGAGGTVNLPGIFNARHVNENIRNAYAHFWSAAFERELVPGTVASVEYTGSAGRKLYDLTNSNRRGAGAVYFGDADPFSRLNNQFYPLNTRGNNGKSDYNALILSLDSSNWREWGLQFTARYTLSSAKDNLSTTFSEGAYGSNNLGVLDPFNPDLDYGYAEFDARHRFVASFNWEVPFGKNYTGIAKQILHGWVLTGIFNGRTGNPFSVFDCTNAFFEVCPRLIPQGAISFSGNQGQDTGNANEFVYIDLTNEAANAGNYADPITGTAEFGPFPENMTKRNAFRAPGFWNFDAGIYKNFRIGEKYTIQFRSEFYNLFNHSNLYVIPSLPDVSASPFVTVKRGFPPVSLNERRNIQLALKFIF